MQSSRARVTLCLSTILGVFVWVKKVHGQPPGMTHSSLLSEPAIRVVAGKYLHAGAGQDYNESNTMHLHADAIIACPCCHQPVSSISSLNISKALPRERLMLQTGGHFLALACAFTLRHQHKFRTDELGHKVKSYNINLSSLNTCSLSIFHALFTARYM